MTIRLALLALWLVLTQGAALAEEPDQVFFDLLFTAQEQQARNNLPAAREAVQQALARKPGDSFAAIRLAQIDALSGKAQPALKALDAVLAADPGNVLAALWRAHALLALGRVDQALQAYQQTLALSPREGFALLGLASCLLARNEDHQALEQLAKAQELAGDDPALHLALGRVFADLGLTVNARLEFERALEDNPRHGETLVRAGEVYQRLNLPSLAMGAWRQALAVNPQDQTALHRLLTVTGAQAAQSLEQGRDQEAVAGWRIMLSYDPQNAQALYHLRALKTGPK